MKKLTNDSVNIHGEDFTKQDIIDIGRLQKQLLIEENLYADFNECVMIWMGYSNDLSASWLFFPNKDEDILKQIKSSDYFTGFESYLK